MGLAGRQTARFSFSFSERYYEVFGELICNGVGKVCKLPKSFAHSHMLGRTTNLNFRTKREVVMCGRRNCGGLRVVFPYRDLSRVACQWWMRTEANVGEATNVILFT